MDPVTAMGLAGVVLQFVKLGMEVARKFAEYGELQPGETPRSLRNINVRLPLLINALSHLQTEAELNNYDPEVRSILNGVVLGCYRLVQELDEIAIKIQPKVGESFSSKLKKAFGSMKVEERIEDIDSGLQGYIQVLILHRVVDRTAAHAVPSEESTYLEVRQKRITNGIARNDLISRLDKSLFKASRGQLKIPEYVIMYGEEGVGKSQLALEYCHQAYNAGQFQTVFWLDGSSPETLRLDLESIASVVRKTKKGTSEEKLKFVHTFLTERWHPWLLIIDNYQHKEFHSGSLTQILPQAGNGAILITTRDYDMPPLGTVVKIYKFLTPTEEDNLRYKVTIALHSKDLDTVRAVLEQGLAVDRPSRSVWSKDGAPLVNIAAEAGFDEGLQHLLDLGANPHLEEYQYTILASATQSGQASTVALCLDYEDNTGQKFEDKDYDTAFGVALRGAHLDCMKILLARRDSHLSSDSRRTSDGFISAAEGDRLDGLRALHSLNRFPSQKKIQIQALCKAIERKNLDIVKFFISEVGLKPDEQDNSGESPLYYAVSIGDAERSVELRGEIVLLLLQAGAPPDMGKKWGERTPLHHMAAYGCASTVKLLLQYGANPLLENEDKLTPLLMALDYKSPSTYPILVNEIDLPDPEVRKTYLARPMHAAAQSGDRDLGLLLLKHCDVNAVDPVTGDTSLLAAIRNSQTSMARMLIRNKANQMIPDKKGTIPMLLVAEKGLELVIKDLSKAADSPGLEVCDEKGNTPLILAVKADHQKAVKVLLGLGADRDATNQFGETALDIAEERDLEEMIKIFDEL